MLERNPALPMESAPLTHFSARGDVHMVDVTDRAISDRIAVAEGYLRLDPSLRERLLRGETAKGDGLAVARVAAIQAAKRTWELIPLCHPIALGGLEVAIDPTPESDGLRLEVRARTSAPTGVEMEALTAVSVGLLTLYDMLKSADPAISIGPIRLVSKSGGRHGDWIHPDLSDASDPGRPRAAGTPEHKASSTGQ